MTVANRKRLEAAHHMWLRRILHVPWRDKITNKGIRERRGQEDMGSIIRKRRLWWLGHVWRIDKGRRANQVLHWVPEGRKRRGRLRKNWTETVKNDLRGLEISWERAEALAMDRVEWRRCGARCTEMHMMVRSTFLIIFLRSLCLPYGSSSPWPFSRIPPPCHSGYHIITTTLCSPRLVQLRTCQESCPH